MQTMSGETYESIPGWFDFQEVYDRALSEVPRGGVFVEVGAWLGRSTAYLAGGLRERGDPLHVVDTWKGSPDIPYMQQVVRDSGGSLFPQFMENMNRLALADVVKPLCMPSVDAAERFENESVDFVFLDGSHRYEDVVRDLSVWLAKLKPGGILAGHDFHPLWPDVLRAVHDTLPRESIRVMGCSFWSYKPGGSGKSADRARTARCVILVPAGKNIEPACEESLRNLEGRGYAVRRVFGYSAIDQARSQMATDALCEGFEELMWIDSDISFDPQAVDALRLHDLPVVCGLYAKKGQRALACQKLPGTRQFTFGAGGGLVEIQYGATGFLLVRRQAMLEVQARLALPVCNAWAERPVVPFFLPMIVERQPGQPWYLGEDFAFFERLRQCGQRIYADTTVRLWHIGAHGYSWEEAGADVPRYATYHFNMPE